MAVSPNLSSSGDWGIPTALFINTPHTCNQYQDLWFLCYSVPIYLEGRRGSSRRGSRVGRVGERNGKSEGQSVFGSRWTEPRGEDLGIPPGTQRGMVQLRIVERESESRAEGMKRWDDLTFGEQIDIRYPDSRSLRFSGPNPL